MRDLVKCCVLASIGFVGVAEAAPPSVAVQTATFARGLNDDQSPTGPAEAYQGSDSVHLSLELRGHPTKGTIRARFLLRNAVISEASVDLAKDAASAPAEGNTFVGFSLKPKGRLPVSDNYRCEATIDGKPLGTYTFRVRPPDGAAAARAEKIVLARQRPTDFSTAQDETTFAEDDAVVLCGQADVGELSWLQAEWLTDGAVDPAATRTIGFNENREDAPFAFEYRPENGWKPGKHEAVLILNGTEVARKPFTVRMWDPKAAGPPVFTLRKIELRRDDGNGKPGETVEAFSKRDKVLHVVCDLEKPLADIAGKIVWRIVSAEGGYTDVVMAEAPIAAHHSDRLAGRFTANRELPSGRYKVEIVVGEKAQASQEFEVR